MGSTSLSHCLWQMVDTQGRDAEHLACLAVTIVGSLLITTHLFILEWGKGIRFVQQTKRKIGEVDKDGLNLSFGISVT